MDPRKEGLVFEALIATALSELRKTYHWGVTPPGFLIDPDFVIGSLAAPTHWILVTSSGSAKESNRKFWRNCAEIFLTKKQFESPPLLINIVFKGHQKASLQTVMEKIGDSQIHVDANEWGRVLIAMVGALTTKIPESDSGKVELLEKTIKSNRNYIDSFNQFKKALAKALIAQNSAHGDLWAYIKDIGTGSFRCSARPTYFRRGVIKLLLFTKEQRKRLFKQKKSSSRRLGGKVEALLELGLASKSVAGAVMKDMEVNYVLDTFDEKTIESILAQAPLEKMSGWIDTLLNLQDVRAYQSFVIDNFEKLTSPELLFDLLRQQHADPTKFSPEGLVKEVSTVWLFYFLFDLIKAYTGKRQGYGLSKLAQDAQPYVNTREYPPQDRVWTIVTSDFVNRIGNETMPDKVLRAQCTVLSELLAQVGVENVGKLGDDIVQMTIVSNLEQKLLTYRMFDPLKILLRDSLVKNGFSFEYIKAHPSFVGELIGQPAKVGTTPMIRVGLTLIHWKSATKNPRDKTKELVSRIQSIRVQFSESGFCKRSGVERCLLLIDGEYTAEQIDWLLASGWDGVFYPDEVDKLASAII